MDYNDDQYDVAQICKNGHVSNSLAREYPQRNKEFCDKCGAKTIIKCPNCEKEIRGQYSGTIGGYKAPNYCINCGNPYPWIESQLQAALELAELDERLTISEKQELSDNMNDLLSDTPRTTTAVAKFKVFLAKAKGPVADGLRQIMVEVATQSVKKQLGL